MWCLQVHHLFSFCRAVLAEYDVFYLGPIATSLQLNRPCPDISVNITVSSAPNDNFDERIQDSSHSGGYEGYLLGCGVM
jgi:hypothetical protein